MTGTRFKTKATTFKIAKMDCPSEEQMIRLKVGGLTNIRSLEFDIPNRRLTVYHIDDYTEILERLDSLNYDTSFLQSVQVENYQPKEDLAAEKKLLMQVLALNFLFFAIELVSGWIARSMGLVADSLDMLADSIVYGLALFAVGGSAVRKKNIAKSAGIFQLALAVFGFIEVIRRFAGFEKMPDFQTMILVSALALIANALCLYLLQKNRSQEAHMRASMIFTSNDVIVNLGVIAAAVLVYITHSMYPDLIIGAIVFTLVGLGAVRIFRLSK